MAKEVVVTMGMEVQVEHLEDPKTTTMTMATQKRWSSHHAVLEEINKV